MHPSLQNQKTPSISTAAITASIIAVPAAASSAAAAVFIISHWIVVVCFSLSFSHSLSLALVLTALFSVCVEIYEMCQVFKGEHIVKRACITIKTSSSFT